MLQRASARQRSKTAKSAQWRRCQVAARRESRVCQALRAMRAMLASHTMMLKIGKSIC